MFDAWIHDAIIKENFTTQHFECHVTIIKNTCSLNNKKT